MGKIWRDKREKPKRFLINKRLNARWVHSPVNWLPSKSRVFKALRRPSSAGMDPSKMEKGMAMLKHDKFGCTILVQLI